MNNIKFFLKGINKCIALSRHRSWILIGLFLLIIFNASIEVINISLVQPLTALTTGSEILNLQEKSYLINKLFEIFNIYSLNINQLGVTLIITLSYGDSFSQSKYGVDSVNCITNLSLFREYYKQKNYMEALSPWRWTFQNCPKASGNIYKNGPIIIKSMIKERPEQKKEYVDTLMLIYDQRIEYFGNEGYVLGRKGADLLRYDKSKFLDANEILDQLLCKKIVQMLVLF